MRETLNHFYTIIADDGRIGFSHISLYVALVYTGRAAAEPFFIERKLLMHLAKIRSRQTYNRCMNDLQEYGYICYSPSSDPVKGSKVCLNVLKISVKENDLANH